MSENLRNYVRSLYAFDAVVQRVDADAWDNASPCEGWTARQVAGHSIWGSKNWTAMATGAAAPAEQAEADVAGSDPVASWVPVRDGLLSALDQPGVLQKVIASPFGEMPLDAALGIFFLDPLVHTWDIAQATGQKAAIPADLAAIGAANLEGAGDAIRAPGLFGPAIDGGSDDAVDRLLRVTGRNPS